MTASATFVLLWIYWISFTSAKPGACQVWQKPPDFLVGSHFRLEARSKCSEDYRVEFSINGMIFSFTNDSRLDSGEHVFEYKRSLPVAFNDAGKEVEVLAKKFGHPVVRSGKQYVAVFDRPVVLNSRLDDERLPRGSAVRKVLLVRCRSPLSEAAVRVLAGRSPIAANVSVLKLEGEEIFEVRFEFAAEKSASIHAEIRSKFVTTKSAKFRLEVLGSDRANSHETIVALSILLSIAVVVIILLSILLRYCDKKKKQLEKKLEYEENNHSLIHSNATNVAMQAVS